MSLFAEIKDKKVVRVLVCDSKEWLEKKLGGEWVETFMNDKGKNYAGIGFEYIKEKSNFATPKPYASWIMTESCKWSAPKKLPSDTKDYGWDELKQDWVESKEGSRE